MGKIQDDKDGQDASGADAVQSPADTSGDAQGNDQTTPAPAEAERPPMAEITGVRFRHGQVDSFSLNTADLTSMGAQEPKGDLTWNVGNNWTVPISEMNASTVDALLEKDSRFSVV